jgi:hypothetical protein
VLFKKRIAGLFYSSKLCLQKTGQPGYTGKRYYRYLPAGTGVSAGLLMQPQVAPYANNEPQGEGIGFAADGTGYYTDTEIKGYPGKLATISFYKRK